MTFRRFRDAVFAATLLLAACGGGGSEDDGGGSGGGFDGPGNGDANNGSDPKDPVGAQGAEWQGQLTGSDGQNIGFDNIWFWLLTEQAAGGSKSNVSAIGSYKTKDAFELTTTTFPANPATGGNLAGTFKVSTGNRSPLRPLLGTSAAGTFIGTVTYSSSGHTTGLTLTSGSTVLTYTGSGASDYYAVRAVSLKVGTFQEGEGGVEKGLVLTFADNGSDDRGQKYNVTGSTADGCTYDLTVNQSNGGYNLYNIGGSEICSGVSRAAGGQATFFNAAGWLLIINSSDAVKNKRSYFLRKS